MSEATTPLVFRISGWVLVGVLVVGTLLIGGDTQPILVLLGAVLMAALSLVAVPTRSRIRLTPATSVVAALPLMKVSDISGGFGLTACMTTVMLGSALMWLMGSTRGFSARNLLAGAVRLLIAGLAYVVLFDAIGARWLATINPIESGWLVDWWQVVTIAVVTPVVFMAEGIVASTVRSPTSRSLRSKGPLELRDFDVYLVLVVSGALLGLTFTKIGGLALIVAGVPFMLAYGAFRRLADTRRTYSQTVRALAQIPEAAGHVVEGHAVRVALLSRAVADYLGLDPRTAERIGWAGYLHDIGRISLNDPGVVRLGYTEADIAEWGSVIVEEATLDDVAEIVRIQHEPYRRPGQQADPELPIEARIIKAASAYDDLTGDGSASPLEALEQLYRGSVYDYDPEIVNAIRTILETRGAMNENVDDADL